MQGAWYIQEVLDALTAVPEVWSKTVLLVNFDENDGYFDHVPSPSAPSLNADGTPAGKTTLREADVAVEYFTHPTPARHHEPAAARRPRLRPRPARAAVRDLAVEPRRLGQLAGLRPHLDACRFLEKRFGVKEPNISRYRRAVCGDLTSAFNFERPNDEPLPTLAGRKTKAEADALRAAQQRCRRSCRRPTRCCRCRPPACGRRARCPTSCTRARAAMRSAARCSSLFANTGEAAAVFHVYDKLTSTACRAATWWSPASSWTTTGPR